MSQVRLPFMVDDKSPTITLRRSTVVGVSMVVLVLAAIGVGLAIGLTLDSKSSPPTTKSIVTAASTTTVHGLTTTTSPMTTTTTVASTTTTPALPAVLSCGPRSTPHVRPTRLKVGCATGNITVTAITWQLWGAASGGQGTGTLNSNSADGTFSSIPAIVVVFNVVDGVFQDVSVVPTITLTTTSTTAPTTPSNTAQTTAGPSPVAASQPGSGWGSD